MANYTYEDVKLAYKAIIEVGKARCLNLWGPVSAQVQHRRNLKELDGSAKELYELLVTDKDINY